MFARHKCLPHSTFHQPLINPDAARLDANRRCNQHAVPAHGVQMQSRHRQMSSPLISKASPDWDGRQTWTLALTRIYSVRGRLPAPQPWTAPATQAPLRALPALALRAPLRSRPRVLGQRCSRLGANPASRAHAALTAQPTAQRSQSPSESVSQSVSQ